MELNPDTLRLASGEELHERQKSTGEFGSGKIVVCYPDENDRSIVQNVSRAVCAARPYRACLSCSHARFEYIFVLPKDDWVMCPRWSREPTGPPTHYSPVRLSECRAKPYPFCPQCPSREELVQLSTDKRKEGWLERYRKMVR